MAADLRTISLPPREDIRVYPALPQPSSFKDLPALPPIDFFAPSYFNNLSAEERASSTVGRPALPSSHYVANGSKRDTPVRRLLTSFKLNDRGYNYWHRATVMNQYDYAFSDDDEASDEEESEPEDTYEDDGEEVGNEDEEEEDEDEEGDDI